MKIQARKIAGPTSFAFSSNQGLDKTYSVTIPASVRYYATCSLHDGQVGDNISYQVEIDIEDRAIIDPNQQINYFLFSNGDVGPQKTALLPKIDTPRTVTVRVVAWPDRDQYENYVNCTEQIAPPDDSYINLSFIQFNPQNPTIGRGANLNIVLVY